MHDFVTALLIAAQDGVGPPVPQGLDASLWPYWVACGTLSTAVAALFGVLMKATKDHALQIEKITEENRKATEERSKRIAEEFARKDSQLLELTTKIVTAMERMTSELAIMNERERRQ